MKITEKLFWGLYCTFVSIVILWFACLECKDLNYRGSSVQNNQEEYFFLADNETKTQTNAPTITSEPFDSSTETVLTEHIITSESVTFVEVAEETRTIEVTTSTAPTLISLGEYKLTAYCPCSKCCGKWGVNRPVDENGELIVITASGKRAKAGITIAADRTVLPFGTKVVFYGHEYEVQDVGGAIKGNRIDVYFDDHQEALEFGVQYTEVFIVREE